MSSVTIYTTPTCAFCRMTKEYLKQKGIEYSEKDITTDADAYKELVEKMNGSFAGVPVIDIDGTVVLGFDRNKIDLALSKAGDK